jgi:cell shape-determining protein MreD
VAAGLLVGSVSGVPWYIYFIGYLVVVAFARLLTRRIWQAPLLAMFTVTFAGTILILMLTFVQRSLFEVPLVFGDVFTQIVLPSLLLNLMLAIPIRSLIQSLAESIYPAEGLA